MIIQEIINFQCGFFERKTKEVLDQLKKEVSFLDSGTNRFNILSLRWKWRLPTNRKQ